MFAMFAQKGLCEKESIQHVIAINIVCIGFRN